MDSSDYEDGTSRESNDRKRPMDESLDSDEKAGTDKIQNEKFDIWASLEDKLEYVDRNRGNIPALLYAAEFADVDVCKELVDVKGADINVTDESGNNVFHCAVANQHNCEMDLFNFFADRGAEIERPNNRGNEATMIALWLNKFELAKKMFDKFEYKTSFLAFCASIELSTIKLIYDQDPSVVKEQVNGREIFDLLILEEMALYQDLETFKWIFKIACDNGVDVSKDIEMLKRILYGAYTNPKRKEGDGILNFLLNLCGTDLKSEDWTTLLTEFLRRGNLNAVQILVNHGADLNVRLEEGQVSLFEYCVGQYSLEAAKFVYAGQKQVEINLCVLIRAVRKADVNMCEWLLQLPRDFELADKAHCLIEEVLSNAKHGADIIRLLEQPFQDVVNDSFGKYNPPLFPLHLAMMKGNLEAAEALLEIGADLNVKFFNKINLLMFCLGVNFPEGAEFVYARDRSQLDSISKVTALLIACMHRNQRMVQWLNEVHQ